METPHKFITAKQTQRKFITFLIVNMLMVAVILMVKKFCYGKVLNNGGGSGCDGSNGDDNGVGGDKCCWW